MHVPVAARPWLPSETFGEHAVVHQAALTRGAEVVRTIMDGHRPDVLLYKSYEYGLW